MGNTPDNHTALGSSRSKNQFVHVQMFKDLPSSKCPVSIEGQWFNTYLLVTFCSWNYLFLHSKDSNANIGIIAALLELAYSLI